MEFLGGLVEAVAAILSGWFADSRWGSTHPTAEAPIDPINDSIGNPEQ
jgi:hypothetical protein